MQNLIIKHNLTGLHIQCVQIFTSDSNIYCQDITFIHKDNLLDKILEKLKNVYKYIFTVPGRPCIFHTQKWLFPYPKFGFLPSPSYPGEKMWPDVSIKTVPLALQGSRCTEIDHMTFTTHIIKYPYTNIVRQNPLSITCINCPSLKKYIAKNIILQCNRNYVYMLAV